MLSSVTIETKLAWRQCLAPHAVRESNWLTASLVPGRQVMPHGIAVTLSSPRAASAHPARPCSVKLKLPAACRSRRGVRDEGFCNPRSGTVRPSAIMSAVGGLGIRARAGQRWACQPLAPTHRRAPYVVRKKFMNF
jgi:hypothetical protein